MKFVRASSLRGFDSIVREAGGDPEALCNAIGLPTNVLADPDLRVRSDMVGAVLDLAARQTGIDDLGLRMAMENRPSTWGPLGLLLTRQRTVGDAFKAAADYLAIHNNTAKVTIEPEGDEVVIWIDNLRAPDALSFDRMQGSELTVGSGIFVFRALMKRDWWPVRVGLPHSARGSLERYKRYFGQIPLFDQDRLYFICQASDMEIELRDYDPEAERVARRIADERLPGPEEGFKGDVARAIQRKLIEGELRAETVADALHIDVRTMQRRLAAEGASFSELLEQTRVDLARTFVEGSRRPLSEVAELLGFQSLSAFSQWYGKTHQRSAAETRAGRRLS